MGASPEHRASNPLGRRDLVEGRAHAIYLTPYNTAMLTTGKRKIGIAVAAVVLGLVGYGVYCILDGQRWSIAGRDVPRRGRRPSCSPDPARHRSASSVSITATTEVTVKDSAGDRAATVPREDARRGFGSSCLRRDRLRVLRPHTLQIRCNGR